MGINRRLTYDMLSEARIDPVQKIQALIDQANQAYQQTIETQGETEWPLMDKDGETYGLKGKITLDKRGYIIIPTDGGTYGSYAPQKIRVLTKSGGKVRVIQGDYFNEGWRDAAKILKQIIRDAEIGNGHFREFDPAWEDSQGDKEQMKANKAALRQMNKNIGRKSNAGFEYLESIIRESVNKVINEAFDYWQQSEDNYLMREKLPNGWEKIERSDDEPIYRDPDGNEYVKDDYGHLVMIESVRRRKRMVRENVYDEYFPDEEQGMDDYYYGVMMTLEPDGLFDDLSEETIQAMNNLKDEYIESERGFCSVMVTKVTLTPDGFDGYDVSIEVAVSAPEIPTRIVEEDVQERVWYWIYEKFGINSPNVKIVDERDVFDRRREEYK